MTKKNIIAMFLAVLCAAALSAQTEADFEVALTDDGNGVVIKGYTGKITSTLKIPATIEGLPVREIGEMAFIGAGTVPNSMGVMTAEVPFAVVIPQGLIKIGDNAFAECALTSVTLPDSVTEIGELAFANYEYHTRTGTLKPPAPLLTSVTLPKGLTKAGRSIFQGNTALKTVVIPEGCSILGENMFEGCTALTAITFPKSITSIPSNAFAGCTGLKTLVIPEGITEIAGGDFRGAFWSCTALTSVTLPSTITTIGGTAFRGCSALTTVTIPDSVVTIDGGNVSGEKTLLEWAFPECGKLNLATQARFRKITVINKAEQERKQREQAEREQKARIAEQQRQEQERARIAEQQRQEQEQARIAEQQRQEQERARIAEQQRHEQGIYAIGETGPAGGIIFYDKGAKSDGWRYLEAAPASSEFEGRWNEAVENCKRMNINGIGGWRLPTVNELNYMYENLAQKGLGSFSKEYLETTYWSSSVSDGYVSSMDLDRGGETASRDTSYHYRVRAIRAF